MKRTLLLLAVLCLGVLAALTVKDPGWLFPSPARQSGNAETSPSPGDVPALPQESALTGPETGQVASATRLAGEDLRYLRMEKQLAELQLRIETLELERLEEREVPGSDTGTPEVTDPASSASGPTSEAKLVAAGIEKSTAAWIQQQLDENALDELYLNNQASREGWLNTNRYRKERQEIRTRINEFREQLGDETYSRLLYALGRPNRILINDVMQGSNAQQMGLYSGDTIVSYDGKRVFSIGEMQQLSSGGDPASWVSLEVIREGESLSLYVPGGPLGVRLSTGRVPSQ